MFTANSMNCLTEALGLALPGNGTMLATHADRERLFVEAGRLIVDLARRYYEQDDESVLPRSIASFEAFENAMTLDIAMGGSTNTVLHLLAAAHEGGRRLHHGRHRPAVAPRAEPLQGRAVVADVPREDVHRAGGIMAHPRRARPRAACSTATCRRCTRDRSATRSTRWDITRTDGDATREFFIARRPAACRPRSPSARTRASTSSTSTATRACIRDVEHAFSKDGGLAVLYGNIARRRLHREDRRRRRQQS